MTSSSTLTGSQQTDLHGTVARLQQRFRGDFDPAYIDNVIVPFFPSSVYRGERPLLPMIDLQFTKEGNSPRSRTPEPEKTFVYYWMKNGEEGEFFQHKD